VTKPDPAIFRHALERIGATAREAVMIGDSWTNDVVGASAVGIRAIWLNRSGHPCPDATRAHELSTFEPIARTVELVLNRSL
jgi:putative hydrolase of the HAD superfamily